MAKNALICDGECCLGIIGPPIRVAGENLLRDVLAAVGLAFLYGYSLRPVGGALLDVPGLDPTAVPVTEPLPGMTCKGGGFLTPFPTLPLDIIFGSIFSSASEVRRDGGRLFKSEMDGRRIGVCTIDVRIEPRILNVAISTALSISPNSVGYCNLAVLGTDDGS
jgi:hypothetical protein